jgi:hypothetical protein
MRPVLAAVGTLALLGAATTAAGKPGDRKRIGEPGAWKELHEGQVIGDRLYAATLDDRLHAIDLATGKSTVFDKDTGDTVAAMTAVGPTLYLLLQFGAEQVLHRYDMKTRKQSDLCYGLHGNDPVVLGDVLYLLRDGSDYVAGVDIATCQESEHDKTWVDWSWMFETGGKLHGLDDGGELGTRAPGDVEEVAIAAKVPVKPPLWFAGNASYLVTIDARGRMHATALATGKSRRIGKTKWTEVQWLGLGSDGAEAYVVAGGTLFRVSLK